MGGVDLASPRPAMSKESKMRSIINVIAAAISLTVLIVPGNAMAASLRNPVLRRDVPDPGVLVVGGAYYVYGTSNGTDDAMPIYRSTDLTTWTRVGQIFGKGRLPAWTEPGAGRKFWGPEVQRIGGRYVAYYSTIDKRKYFSIGVAVATTPAGPFRDLGRIASNPRFSLIDPSYFRDPRTGRHYLLWKDNTNAQNKPAHIVLHELDSSGLHLGPGPSRRLITNDLGWEGKVVEAPTLVYHNGSYYLFYSGNNYDTDGYAVGYARSNRVDGGYAKSPRNPILRSDQQFDGPGGQSVVHVGGQWLMFYHARLRQAPTRDRVLMADRLWWDGLGQPHVHDGTPSE